MNGSFSEDLRIRSKSKLVYSWSNVQCTYAEATVRKFSVSVHFGTSFRFVFVAIDEFTMMMTLTIISRQNIRHSRSSLPNAKILNGKKMKIAFSRTVCCHVLAKFVLTSVRQQITTSRFRGSGASGIANNSDALEFSNQSSIAAFE
ncbi:hypothetical protein TcasGA2_TC001884 [Tribolium castaneum]|uniref:Uncharacterized protein n=1 Tax=Tribolium castaneum TaxID=7070 RepID=D7EJP8_TRICA|nr:hypothetical protein TcasGA2_TC001884 [Tribolium castaneum]